MGRFTEDYQLDLRRLSRSENEESELFSTQSLPHYDGVTSWEKTCNKSSGNLSNIQRMNRFRQPSLGFSSRLFGCYFLNH